MKKMTWFTLASSVVVTSFWLAGCDSSSAGSDAESADSEDKVLTLSVPQATPPGITLQPLGKAQGYGLDKSSATALPRDEIAYTNAEGMTLYSFEEDVAGKSTCIGACAETWPPMLAGEDAEPLGHWSIIVRPDGSRQWALKEKPLHTYIEDVDIGSVAGNSPKVLGRGKFVGIRGSYRGPRPEKKILPFGWNPALLYPVTDTELPVGITAREVRDAIGLALVDRESNKTLYVFSRDPNRDEEVCASPCEWEPLAAPALASSEHGDFGLLERDDGIRQWTWKGMGLYTSANDFGRDDANGVHEHWKVAKLLGYFMPDSVSYVDHPKLGKILATDGQTLYRREGFILKSGSGHSLHRGVPIRPAVGRDMGIEPRCNLECEKWQPFLAAEDAKPVGYWNAYERADGTKQWAYQGFALWTYADDEQEGAARGHDIFDLAIGMNPKHIVEIGTPYDGATALQWHVATP